MALAGGELVTFNCGGPASTDGGASWSASYTPGSVNALVIDPVTPTTLYGSTYGNFFKSTDSGTSWRAFNSGLPYTNILTSR